MEVSAFMTAQLNMQLDKQREREEKMEAKQEARDAKMEAKFELQRQEIDLQRQEMERLREEAKPQRASDAITDESLDALQSRLQELHAAQLLSEEEMVNIENAIADCIDLLPTALCTDSTVDKVAKMINMSGKMKNEASFARQLRRRFT